MLNRRDLMKYFGAGAIVMPVVGGIIEQDATARIIQPPTVELASAPLNGQPLDFNEISNVTSITYEMCDGTKRTISGTGYTWGMQGYSARPDDQLQIEIKTYKLTRHNSPPAPIQIGSVTFAGVLL